MTKKICKFVYQPTMWKKHYPKFDEELVCPVFPNSIEGNTIKIINTYQTVFGEINEAQNVTIGYGQGSFVVFEVQKK